MVLPLTELKSVFLSFPIIWSKLDHWGLTEQYATLFPSPAHQMLDVPSCHIVGPRLNDPDLFNQPSHLLSPSPLIVLFAFVVSDVLNPFSRVLLHTESRVPDLARAVDGGAEPDHITVTACVSPQPKIPEAF